MYKEHGHEYRTGRGRRAKDPEALRADVENFRREDREERGGTPEQHGKQIQHLRTKQLRLRQEKADPDREILANGAFVRDNGMPRVPDAREQSQSYRAEHRLEDVSKPRTGESEDHSAKSG